MPHMEPGSWTMGALQEPKIDCHNHILDPERYPYSPEVGYRPQGQEIGTEAQLQAVCDTYGVKHCLIVGPNSGYGFDNRCLLDAIARSNGRYKGIAVVSHDISLAALAELKRRGIVGIAVNTTVHGTDYYADIAPLIGRLHELDMFLQIQTEGDQVLGLLPLITGARVKILIDHCGRPIVADGLSQAGFKAVLSLAETGRATVKLSGYAKFAAKPYPYEQGWPFVRALVDAYSLDQCLWGSDWPFLRAPERLDYGPLLALIDRLFPVASDRKKLLWETPCRVLGFDNTLRIEPSASHDKA
jgi:predicted TIM-barrel fold metal-dependent hydrolase